MRILLAIVLVVVALIIALPGMVLLLHVVTGSGVVDVKFNGRPVSIGMAISLSLIPASLLALLAVLALSIGRRRDV
jgi:hypothetical protein